MGGSSYSDDIYNSRVDDRAARGVPTFAHDHDIKTGKKAAGAHASLSPFKVNRESRDSDAHPESNAIGVMFDVTGSMGSIPVTLQKKLPQLMGLLTRKDYIPHPQILFGAIGDVYSDTTPLQVGQFESGLEMDDNITNIFLEGNGGGQNKESYQDALYFFARHTSIDCLEKRGKKGYLFVIGDEQPYPTATRAEVASLMGDTIESDLTVEQVVAEAQEKYNVFFIIPKGASNSASSWLKDRWQTLLGAEHVLMLDKPDSVCEAIAVAIGACEGTTDIAGATADLKAAGTSTAVIADVTRALDPLAAKTALARIGSGTGTLPERAGKSSKTARL